MYFCKMKKQLKIIDYDNLVHTLTKDDHRIGDQIFLMDEYQLNPVRDYEFTAPENVFIEVLSGKGYIIVDGVRHNVSGRSLIAYLKGQRIIVKVSGKKTIQRGAAFSDEFMEDMYRSSIRFNDIKTSLLTNPVVRLGEEQAFGINVYINVLRHIAAQNDNPNNLTCAKHVTLALFYGPLHGIFKTNQTEDVSSNHLISAKFYSLVEDNFKDKTSLAFYAASLNISKPYLHQCIVATSGKAPGYWIDYYRLSYAKKCLTNMDQSVLEIAQGLNFAGLPQFCKFFKNKTDLTPTGFRKSLL